jgi:hypothetical protein
VPPKPAAEFWGYITVGGIAQMLATACVVALFARRNFAVGITLKKTEVILTALIGLVVLGEGVSTPVVAAIGVGFLGVLLLSDPPKGEVALPWRDRVFNAASGYGLASGLLFGISAVCYRGATLSLPHGDAVIRAAVALLAATVVQTATLGLWLAIRERGRDRARAGRMAGGGVDGTDLDAGLDGLVHRLRAADGGLCEGAGTGGTGLHLPLLGLLAEGKIERQGNRRHRPDRRLAPADHIGEPLSAC